MTAPQRAAEQAAREEFVDELKPGTKLLQGQYTITRFINSGGFGITYLAKDSLDRDVVIKECFPGNFCRRSDTIVGARSRAHQAEFRSIVKLFVQEARSLAKLAHPNIVGVHQVFEDNDTAYMAIDFIDGRDLLDLIEDPTIEMTPSKIVTMTHKLLTAVGFIHDSGILHRDISPDNILINKKGEPILIDFGAAREEATRASRALSALRVVKDGYSPQEFYIAGSEQGPWSDLYALAATLYHAITGQPPANSQVRLAAIAEGNADPYEALSGRFAGYPLGFLEAIDKALHAVPRRRIQNAAEWQEMLANPSKQIRDADPLAAVSRLLSEQTLEPDVQVVLPEPPTPPAEPQVTVAEAAVKPEVDETLEPAEEPETRNDAGVENAAATVVQAPVQPTRISSKPQPKPLPAARGGSGRGLLMGLSAVAVLAVLGFVVLSMDDAGMLVAPPSSAPEEAAPAAPAAADQASLAPAPAAETADADAEATAAATGGEATREAASATADASLDATQPQAPAIVAAESPAAAATSDPAEVASVAPVVEAPAATAAAAVEDRTETVANAALAAAAATVAEQAQAAEAGAGTAEDAPAQAAAPTAPAATEAPAVEVESEPEATATDAVESPTVETAAVETAAEEGAAAKTVVPAESQVALAVWDVDIPFDANVRTIGGVNYATIRSLDETADFSIAGDWIREGTTIFSVNGNPVSPSQNVGALILRNLAVERDGMARASVRIKLPGDSQYNRVQLAVPVLRRVSLADGLATEARFEGDRWSVVVLATGSAPTTLRAGDVILSETLTDTALVHADSLEDAVGKLAGMGRTVAEFEIERKGVKMAATYALATK